LLSDTFEHALDHEIGCPRVMRVTATIESGRLTGPGDRAQARIVRVFAQRRQQARSSACAEIMRLAASLVLTVPASPANAGVPERHAMN